MTIRARDVLAGRLPHRGEDTGNIAMVLMAIIVGATLGALMLTMILSQDNATRFDSTRVRALDGAQAGIDVMLGQIRHATAAADANGVVFGDAGQLPCGSLSGSPNGTGTVTYTVSVAYYLTDPAKSGATPMSSCVPGYGPYDTASSSHTPRYAKITSFGQDATGVSGVSKGRTLTTTYVFQTDDVNIPGGQIQVYPDGSGKRWCMDAGSAAPAAGTSVLLQPCSTSTPIAPQQSFAYRSDLSIQLVSSVTTANPNGLCLDTNSSTHASGVAVVLATCAVINPAKCKSATACSPWNQQWSVDDYAHLQGATTTQSDVDGYCIAASTQAASTALLLATCTQSTTDIAQTWVLSPTAGAGMAGASNNQIVNFQNFATCIDVTGKDPSTPYLILYTCKQNPNPTNVAWNQKFTPALGPPSTSAGPKTGTLTANNGTAYCLHDPGSSGGYVTVTTDCSSTWTWYQTKATDGSQLAYAQVYTIVDSAGLCLAPGLSSDLSGPYYKVIVTKCDGATDQKWNADPTVLASRLANTGEK